MYDRQPILAGAFYPAEPDRLAASVDALLEAGARVMLERGAAKKPASFVMIPHAGHVYCGRVAGETLARSVLPERLIILCPNHTGQGAPLAVWPEGSWSTPLGPVPVDVELARSLLDAGEGYTADTRAHAREHAVEVVLPYLQRHTPGCAIVPIVVSAGPDVLRPAGRALAKVMRTAAESGRPAGVVLSTDMHHFGTETQTLRLDEHALERIRHLDADGLLSTVRREMISMCGVQAACVAIHAARDLGADGAEVVAHTTSADVTGDPGRVVGYAGALFLQAQEPFALLQSR